MADKTETLLFLIDVQVRNSKAIRALDAELDAVAAAHERRLLALNRAVTPGNGGGGLAPLPPAGNGGNSGAAAVIANGGNGGSSDARIYGVRGPHRPFSKENPGVVVEESGQAAGLGSLAAALADARKGEPPVVKTMPAPTPAGQDEVLVKRQAQILANLLAGRRVQQAIGNGNGAGPLLNGNGGGPGLGTMSAAAAAHRLGVPTSRVYELASAGQLAGAQKTAGQWSIPEQAVIDMVAAGAGGGGGGARPPIVVGHGGGGGGRGFLSRLGWGGGIAGMATAGSLASFAGLGFEHILFTALGLAGSATAAAGGAGLLGLGSLGKLGVGGGSDLAAMTTTIAQVKNLDKAYANLQNAVATYGKGSKQAQQAQQQLNVQLAQLKSNFGPQAAAAINGVSLSLQALSDNWGHSIAPAMVQATHIIQQALGTANTFVPMIGQAATRNLSIINQGLKPLFAWLQGPQGIQIFNDLENAFAKDLPTAVHAGSQALELLLRVIDIASQDTGGFVGHLDHLFTRLNGLDSATLGREISKLVDDFRLWDHFLGLVGKDVFLLFHQDVGTGNSIIGTLTGMLVHLQAYEKSARGQAQIQNIFMVHKTEILELIHIFAELSKAFGSVYLAVAPAAVTVMNDVVLPVLSAVAKALAAIAHSSPLAADALGALLIGAKFGGWRAALGGLRGSTQWLLGTGGKAAAGAGVAETAVAGAGGGLAGGVARGLPGLVERGALGLGGGLEALGAGGAGLAVVGAGGAISAALPIVIPAVVAGVAAYFGIRALFGAHPTATATPGGLQLPQDARSYRAGRGGPTFALPGGLSQDTLNVKEVGNFAHYSATQLAELITEMKQANGLKLNGIEVPKKQLIALAEAALKAKDAWNQSFDTAWSAVNKFYRNTSRTLPALYDDFNSNMKLIAHTMGLNSDEGRKLVADNIAKMVVAVTRGMLDGKISATGGMTAIRQALGQGMKDNAITWDTEWKDMIDTVGLLYANHKLTTKQWLADVRSIQKTGLGHIQADAHSSYQKRFADLKKQFDDGLITHGQFLSKIHAAQLAANAQAKGDWGKFDSSIALAMIAAGTAAGQGITQITSEVNAALGLFGAQKIPLAAIQKATPGQLAAIANGTVSPGGFLSPHATGGKITSPLIMVGEEAPCIAEGTLIETSTGARPIEVIRAGERVLTRNGYRDVLWSGATRFDATVLRIGTIGGENVVCTPDHRIWTLRDGDERGDCLGCWPVRGRGDLSHNHNALQDQSGADAYRHDGPRRTPAVPRHRRVWESPRAVSATGESQAVLHRGRREAVGCTADHQGIPPVAGRETPGEGAGTADAHRGARCCNDATAAGVQVRTPTHSGEHVRQSAGVQLLRGVQEDQGARVHATQAGDESCVSRAGARECTGVSAPQARWREARDLIAGDYVWVLGPAGLQWAAVEAVELLARRIDTYDLVVDTDHEFIAGGILVHNSHPEFVLATNPAYRGRNLDLWAAAGRELGVPGFAMGGIVTPNVLGGSGASPALARAGLGKVASAANAFLGAHMPTGGGALAGAFSGQGGPPSANQALGRKMMLAAGWGADQWPFLLALWNQESGWNANAVNSSSGAYGIPQSLGHGHPFNLGDAPAQIAWGLNYIRGTYGSPAGAWAHERAFNWYARGGVIGRMLRMAQGGGYPVVTGGSMQPVSHHGPGAPIAWLTNTAITGQLSGIANQFQGYQSSFGNIGSLASILQGLAPGTSLASIGLGSAASLKAAGLTRAQARGLIGGGPGSFGVLQQIDQGEIAKYKTEDAKLRQLYRDALHNHNKKLQKTLLDQMQAVDSALAQVVSDKQAAFIAEIQAKAQAFSDQSTAIGGTLSSLQGIENLAPGTSLAGLGLSPGILATLGLSGAQGAVGTGLSYFQNLAQQQGGTLTAAQLAQAQSGIGSQNSLLTQQETPIENELAYYQSVLPSLTGSDRTNAISAMQQLVQTLLGLQGTIDTNNQSLTQLTQATNANTTATAAMTGTVAYSFQGNPYTPASLSSDTTIGLGVGN